MGWYDRWVLSFLAAGMSILELNLSNASFRAKYKNVLKQIVKTADMIRPYIEE